MANIKYNSVVLSQASSLEKAVEFLRNTLGDDAWLWLYKLSEAASSIRENCKGDDWAVQIDDMEIPIEPPKHLKPKKLAGNLKMYVSISMEGSGEAWKNNEDCIKSLRFKVEVLEKDKNDAQKFFHTGFHIDKMDSKDTTSEMHPLYHVHFLNDSQIEGTDVLAMDVPRLMHHPIDIFLGILLVYANYNQTGYKKLLQDGYFMGLCRKSAKHVLEPYYRSLSKVPWTDGLITEYDKSLCPYLTT